MIVSITTRNPVVPSEVEGYAFYDKLLDKNLHLFEAEVVASKEAIREALKLAEEGIPDNYSNDKALEVFARNYLDTEKLDLDEFKKLDALTQPELEYDQAVLLLILF